MENHEEKKQVQRKERVEEKKQNSSRKGGKGRGCTLGRYDHKHNLLPAQKTSEESVQFYYWIIIKPECDAEYDCIPGQLLREKTKFPFFM